MSRIPIPATLEVAPEASKPTLEAIKKQIGALPNVFRMMSNSPAVLEAYAALNGALGKGKLDKKIRERIALAIAQINGCEYCLAAHTLLAKSLGFTDQQILDLRRANFPADPKLDALVKLAKSITENKGHADPQSVDNFFAAGYSKGALIDVVIAVADKIITNYVFALTAVPIDYPLAPAL